MGNTDELASAVRVVLDRVAALRGGSPSTAPAASAIVPTSLGVNPSLIIAALALRCADQIIREVDAGDETAAFRDAVPVFTVVSDEAPVLPAG